MVRQELKWDTLVKAWVTTLAIYSLSGATPLIMELLLEGTVSRIALVSFIIGFWGVFSGGLIYMLKQKGQTLEAGDFKEAQDASTEVQQLAAGQVIAGAKAQEEIRAEVKKVAESKDYNSDLREPPTATTNVVSYSYPMPVPEDNLIEPI